MVQYISQFDPMTLFSIQEYKDMDMEILSLFNILTHPQIVEEEWEEKRTT